MPPAMPAPCASKTSWITLTFDPTIYLVHPTVAGDGMMPRLMDCCPAPVPSFNPLEIDALRATTPMLRDCCQAENKKRRISASPA